MSNLIIILLIMVYRVLNNLSSFFFKFIHLHLIFILDLVFILLIVMYLVLSPLLN